MTQWATQNSKYEQCIQEIEEVLRKYELTLAIENLYDPDLDRVFYISDRDMGTGFNAGYTGGELPRLCDSEQLQLLQ